MRYCILCGTQVADGVRGTNRLGASVHQAFGDKGLRMGLPVVESSQPDEEEHMVFEHGFSPLVRRVVDDKIVELGPWVCTSEAGGYNFGEQWERIDSRRGRKLET